MVKRAILWSLGDVDIRLVRIFVTVTECGGFAASEAELNIGRSTISRHIADLETRVGLTLCHRGPSGFALTEEGAQVLSAARSLLRALDGFQARVDNIHENLTGTLRLGLFDQSSTNPNAKVHRAIALFDHIAPEVMLEITLQPPNILEAQVLEGGLELAIIPQHRQSTSLTYEYLYEERMVLCCGRGHVLFDAQDETVNLSAYKYAGFGFNSPNMKAGQDLGLKRAARVQEEEALALLIQSGRYIGYLADHVAAPLLAAGEVRVLSQSDSGYTSRFAAITRKKPIPDRKTLEFLNCLRTAHETQSSPR